MSSILDITGTPYDAFCNNLGLNPTILAYNNRPLIPRPIVAYRGPQPRTDVPSDLNGGEVFETWDSSIPVDTLRASLGVSWELMVQPAWSNQLWTVQMPNSKKAVRVRVFGPPKIDALGDRYELTFVGMGEDDT